MIQYLKGNLMDVKTGIIVHGCNAQGVMGSGVAKAVKEMYPIAFSQYERDVKKWDSLKETMLGKISVVMTQNHSAIIVSAITQDKYGTDRRQVNYEAVHVAFERIKYNMPFWQVKDRTINIPKIGAGLGGGNWKIIETIINEVIGDEYRVICWEL